MESRELLDTISSKEDLAVLIDWLQQDWEGSGGEWENPDIGRYLAAMAAWLRDIDRYYRNVGQPIPTTPTWKTIAEI